MNKKEKNNELREAVIDLRKKNIKYGEIADLMELPRSTIYNWLHRNFDFGLERLEALEYMIDAIS